MCEESVIPHMHNCDSKLMIGDIDCKLVVVVTSVHNIKSVDFKTTTRARERIWGRSSISKEVRSCVRRNSEYFRETELNRLRAENPK